MEFHYVCGKEYGGDGPCSCAFNHDLDDDDIRQALEFAAANLDDEVLDLRSTT